MKTWILILSLAVILINPALGQSEAARKKNFNIDKSLALDGYDPVSYFSNKPAEGQSRLSYIHHGITYYFSSPENLNKFKTNPDMYEPAYGGWCAYAMGETGEKVKVDPETFKILEGKLYLFYNFWGNNTLSDWNKDEKNLKSKAASSWKKLIQ